MNSKGQKTWLPWSFCHACFGLSSAAKWVGAGNSKQTCAPLHNSLSTAAAPSLVGCCGPSPFPERPVAAQHPKAVSQHTQSMSQHPKSVSQHPKSMSQHPVSQHPVSHCRACGALQVPSLMGETASCVTQRTCSQVRRSCGEFPQVTLPSISYSV